MIKIHPQYITDTAGQKMVILSMNEFDTILAELEELEDVRLYDESKLEDDGSRISFEDYIKERKLKNA